MRSALVLAIALIGLAAQADIPAPHPLSQDGAIGAAESEVLYNAISGQAMPIDVLRTRNSAAKVLRSEDGLNQVICIKTVDLIIPADMPHHDKAVSYSCKTQKSSNGKALPVFKPAVRMG